MHLAHKEPFPILLLLRAGHNRDCDGMGKVDSFILDYSLSNYELFETTRVSGPAASC
jgi:hypothetical protein